MQNDSKLMHMLSGYAAAHQHPFNIAVHLIGIPTIMLGVSIPLTWIAIEIGDFRITMAQGLVIGIFAFYMTLDRVFALVFLIFGLAIVFIANLIGTMDRPTAGTIAAAAFFGGYLAQFIGHAVERSMPVLMKHPVQANLAAPFFTIVEIFHLLGFRKSLFEEVRSQVTQRRKEESATT
jgi:uncharacterized membrane protein YGL010W